MIEKQPANKSAPEQASRLKSGVSSERDSAIPEKNGLSINRRVWVFLVGIVATVFAAILIAELYDIQVVKHDKYALMASQMHWRRIRDIPVRGDILDVNGNVLASTTYEYTVGITPKDVRSINTNLTAEEIGAKLVEYLHLDLKIVTDALSQTEATYIQLAKKIPHDDIEPLKEFMDTYAIGGIKIDSVPKRYYVYGDLASQVIGFADQNNTTLIGQYGVEAYYDSILAGTEGYTYAEVDNFSSGALPYSPPTTVEKKDGYNIVLNIDMNIQQIAEKACEDAMYAYDPQDGVCAIVMEPYTCAVLAMASVPDYDLNQPRSCPELTNTFLWDSMSDGEKMEYLMYRIWRNRAISDTYEPGSTFKVLTTAIALEEGLTYEDEMFSDAPIKVSELHTIHCWSETKYGNHGTETLRQAFERSCNPIFVQLSQRIGVTKYYEYVRNFGFYDKTGIDLPAEEKGIFHENPSPVDMATLSFGESSTVTPLQLANVYCALVNGGTLMKPQVAKYLTDSNGTIVKDFDPEPVKTIFSDLTADRVKEMMKTVVTEGTGTEGYVEGYRVAGKTSTSTIDVGVDEGMHVLSFGCYAPYDNPSIVVLVVINKPADKELGSGAATRVAAHIVSETLEYMGVERVLSENDYNRMTTKYALPDVVGMTFKEANRTLYNEGFTVLKGDDNMTDEKIITVMYPTDEDILYRRGTVTLYSGDPESLDRKQVMVPDFTGKNISECLRLARESGVNISITGAPEGVVISQTPEFGYAMPEENPADLGEAETEETEDGQAIPPAEESRTDGELTDTPESQTADPDDDEKASPGRITAEAGTIIKLVME